LFSQLGNQSFGQLSAQLLAHELPKQPSKFQACSKKKKKKQIPGYTKFPSRKINVVKFLKL
jgi:hypothetical protein